MNTILVFLVICLCMYMGIKTYNEEEANQVFAKYKIQVEDVKKYNHFCGLLIMGFGVVAGFTFFAMISVQGWLRFVCFLLILVESFVLVKIYQVGEKKMLKKR